MLKSFSRAVEKFCMKHRRFGIPRLMLGVVAISAVVYLLLYTDLVISVLAFDPSMILRGQIWRLVTWIFMPINGISATGFLFTVIMLYFYYNIGSTLEREWGTGQFTIYYALGVLLHVVYGFIMYFAVGWYVFGYISLSVFYSSVYLNLSMFFAYAVMYPNVVIRLFFIIPVKIKWAAWLNAVFFAYSFISNLVAGNYVIAFLPLVAILNFFLFCGEDLLASIRPVFIRMKRKRSPQVIDFRKEAMKVKRDLDNKPYHRKCDVCGITDNDDPKMEFRYCSQCAGYHCFCIEHINSHIHFQGDNDS